MDLIKLTCGAPYPLTPPPANTAVADFLRDSGSALVITLDPLDATDAWAIRQGPITAGLLSQGAALLLVFRFHNPRGQAFMAFDCPFDIRRVPPECRELPSMESAASRLAFQIHAVDGHGILRGLRYLTLPLDVSTRFLATVMEQAADPLGEPRAAAQVQDWLRIAPATLYARIAFSACGQ